MRMHPYSRVAVGLVLAVALFGQDRWLRPGATLTARWTYEDRQVVDESRQNIVPTESATVTEFHLSKPDGWPAGGYKVEVLLDGTSVRTRDFKVRQVSS